MKKVKIGISQVYTCSGSSFFFFFLTAKIRSLVEYYVLSTIIIRLYINYYCYYLIYEIVKKEKLLYGLTVKFANLVSDFVKYIFSWLKFLPYPGKKKRNDATDFRRIIERRRNIRLFYNRTRLQNILIETDGNLIIIIWLLDE